jgi:hypothetical protein
MMLNKREKGTHPKGHIKKVTGIILFIFGLIVSGLCIYDAVNAAEQEYYGNMEAYIITALVCGILVIVGIVLFLSKGREQTNQNTYKKSSLNCCINCGNEMQEGTKYCPSCGILKRLTRIKVLKRANRMATASLVIGIIGICLIPLTWVGIRSCFFLTNIVGIFIAQIVYCGTPILFIIAIVFAIASMRKARKLGIKSPRRAIVGLTLSIIGVIIIVAIGISFFLYFSNPNNT